MRIVVAIPTNGQRPDTLQQTIANWRERTAEPLGFHVTTYGKTWAAGLNDAWRNHPDTDLLICGSDDMWPQNGEWLPAIQPYIHKACIAPQVLDPRFSRWDETTSDGDVTRMSSFPIFAGDFMRHVFPLPEELHYYTDDLISDRLKEQGIPTVAVPSCVIVHGFDPRGRGAGMGDESTRMAHDRAIYQRL